MKKIISILCIVALLVTSLGMSLISAVATTSSNVTVPQNVSTSATQVENTSPLPLSTLYKTDTEDKSVSFDPVSANNAGVMFYVEAPENDTSLKFAVYLWSDTNNMWHARYSSSSNSAYNWYYYDSKLGFWSPVVVDKYGVYLPANYKGYVYMSTASLCGLSDASKVFTEADTISKAYIYGTRSTGGELVFSAPLFVSGDNQATTAPAFNSVVLDEVEYSLNTIDTNPVYEGDTVIMPSFVDNNGLDFYPEGTSKVTLPASVATSNITVAENTTGLPLGALFNIPDAAESHLYIDPVRGTGTNGLMMYVEAPVTTDSQKYRFYAYFGIIDSETGKKTCYMSDYAHTYAQFAEVGSSYWKVYGSDTSTSNHSIYLPSGFKGYLYIPFNTLSNVSGNGVGTYTENDILTDIWFLNTDRTNVGNDQYLKVSAPILTKGTFAERTHPINSLVWHGDTYLLDGSGLIEVDSEYEKPTFSGLNTAIDFSAANNVPGDAARGYEQLSVNLNPLSAHPSYAYNNKTANITNGNYAFFADYKVSEYTYPVGSQFDGFLVYVDVSANISTTGPAHLNMGISASDTTPGGAWACSINGSAAVSYNNNPAVYLLWDDGEKGTTWTERKLPTEAPANNTYDSNYTSAEGVILPAGFKGYIYVPYDVFYYNHHGVANIKYLKIGLTSASVDTTFKYFVSAPVAFQRGNGFDPAENPTNTVINGPTAVVDLDTNEWISAGFDSYNKPATYNGINPNIAVDPSLVPCVDALATSQTRFGAHVWHPYNAKANIAAYRDLSGGLEIGDGSSGTYTDANAKISTVFTDDIIKNHPAIKVEAVSTALSGSLFRAIYGNKDSDEAEKVRIVDDAGFMVYFVNDSDFDKEIYVYPITTYNESGNAIYTNFKYSRGNSRVLEKNTASWVPVTGGTADANIILPKKFEGYVFFDFASFADFTTVKGHNYNLAISFQIYNVTIAAGDSFTFSLPMYVTNFADDYNDTAFIVNGAEYAQDILTGDFTKPYDNNGDMKLDVLDLVYNKVNYLSNTHFRKNYFGFRDYVKPEAVNF